MTASFVASFLIFIVTGIYELFWGKADFFTNTPKIRNFVYGIIFLNACYYYYFAAFAEMDPATVLKLRRARRLEWGVRVINQTILFGLWFLLHFGWMAFGIGLNILYISYLLWDAITLKQFSTAVEGQEEPKMKQFQRASKEHFLVILDVAGCALTEVFLFFRGYISGTQGGNPGSMTASFFFGLMTGLYALLVVAGLAYGIFICGFFPLQKKYLTRPELR